MSELRQRHPRQENPAYLAFIRDMPCLICRKSPVDPAHIRMGCIAVGKDGTGGGQKSDDKWALPLCRDHHDEQHAAGSEILFWRHYRIDPFAMAARLYAAWCEARNISEPEEPERYRTKKKRSSFKRPSNPQPFPRRKQPWPTPQLKSRGFRKARP
ncbi:DUF968 domain-containing protein [Bradyrhizobium sp. 482_C4_N1_1]|uniref:DUF968 domain-containing protein n=1 Tax=unclassified Bradyrhizobium TaxID=2631580 RepID=UPI003F8B9061